MTGNHGLVYVFTGDGKGKTSAALGVAVRMLLQDKRVVWISWYKTNEWQISESRLPVWFPRMNMYFIGEGFFLRNGKKTKINGRSVKYESVKKAVVYDKVSRQSHIRAARDGLSLALECLRQKDPPDLLVLDEALQAVVDGLISEEDVLDVVAARGAAHVVLTGRGCSARVNKMADLVSEIVKVKHPYDKGKLAVKGLDF